jgi:hypothetical protein
MRFNKGFLMCPTFMAGGAIFKKENNLALGAASGSSRLGSLREKKEKKSAGLWYMATPADLRTPDAARVCLCFCAFFIVF